MACVLQNLITSNGAEVVSDGSVDSLHSWLARSPAAGALEPDFADLPVPAQAPPVEAKKEDYKKDDFKKGPMDMKADGGKRRRRS